MTTRDPLSPQWEDCKVCGGDHWTKDHMPKVTPSAHRVIPAMRNGVLRHPPTCVNCDQPVEFPGSEWQHVAPSEP